MLHQHDTPSNTTAQKLSETEQKARIRELNDIFRRQQQPVAFMLGEYFKTPGIRELPWGDQWAIVNMVKQYDHFDKNNDPHGEHDFGAFSYKGQRIFWKIDYYDPKLSRHSEDAADPQRTVRVLTIYLAEEH